MEFQDSAELLDMAHEINAVSFQFEQKQSAALVRAVLRGERPVSNLAGTGISPSDPASCAGKFAGLPVCSADLAEGLLNLKTDPAALTDWALFVLRAADLFDYAGHDVPGCKKLMIYIWQIAYGHGLSQRAITMATMLRNWPQKRAG